MAKFVIQKHDAERAGPHLDFRIEINGKAKSWAIKHWPKRIYEKRLAVKQPDHTVSYMDFEGIIPHGEYGAGAVRIKDEGDLEIIHQNKNKITFVKDNIKYILFQTSGDDWLIERLN